MGLLTFDNQAIFKLNIGMQNLLRLSLLLLLIFPLTDAFGQPWKFYRHEVRFGLGASNFLGELGGANQEGTHGLKDFEFNMTRPAVEVGYSYFLSPLFKLRGNLVYGRLNGDDKLTKERFRNNRNLHFRSPIIELAGMVEFHPFGERFDKANRMRGTKGGSTLGYWSPYIAAGIGGFWFNPKAKSPTSGKWVALQPLGTEGQGLPGGPAPYKRIGLCIPLSIGVNYALSREWSIGFEMGGRITFTDYIDDVSGNYYDNAAIRAAKGNEAAHFADPNLGLIPPFADGHYIYDPTKAGMQRGQPDQNDRYLFAIISVHYRFLKGRSHPPKL